MPKYEYIALRVDGRRIDEHRLVVERLLGRRLLTREIVHHINGCKTDNRAENLSVVSARQHALEHTVIYPAQKPCVVCGQLFEPPKTHRKRAKVCSTTCRSEHASRQRRNPEAPHSMYRAGAYPSEVASRKRKDSSK